jgi:hypothetical protein
VTTDRLVTQLRRRGVRFAVSGDTVKWEGRVSRRDARRLERDKRAVARILRGQAQREAPAKPPYVRLPGGGVLFPPRTDRPYREWYPGRDAERRAEAGFVASEADRARSAAAAAAWATEQLEVRTGPWRRLQAWIAGWGSR